MSDIKPNQNVKLFLDSIDVVLDCKVKMHENDRIVLDYEKSILEYTEYLQEGDEVGVKIFTPVGVFIFNSMILYSPTEGDFIIEYIESSPKIQRRDYARIDFEMDVTIEQTNKRTIEGKTIDISGGGIRFKVDPSEYPEIEPEDIIKLTLYLPKEPTVTTYAKIINNPHLPKYTYVLQFNNINETDRERIIRKIHELQRRYFSRASFETTVVLDRRFKENVVGRTIDISGGGVKFEILEPENVKFSKNEEVKVSLYVPENLPVIAKAQIVDIANLPDNIHVLQFVEIDAAERKRLIQITEDI